MAANDNLEDQGYLNLQFEGETFSFTEVELPAQANVPRMPGPIQAAGPVALRSLKNWNVRKEKMDANYGWIWQRELPKERINEGIDSFYMDAAGRKLSRMERHKIRKDMESRKEKLAKRRGIVDSFYEEVNRQEQDFQDPQYKTNRNSWSYLGVFENREDRIRSMNAFAQDDPREIVACCEILFQRFEAFDMTKLTYRTKDDLFAVFHEVFPYVRGGMNLRWAIGEYQGLGGILTRERYLRLNAIADVMENMQNVFDAMESMDQDPMSILVREEDLESLSDEELIEKVQDFSRLSMKYGEETGRGMRFGRLFQIYQKYLHARMVTRPNKNRPGEEVLFPGRNGQDYFEALLKQRKEGDNELWLKAQGKYRKDSTRLEQKTAGFGDWEKEPVIQERRHPFNLDRENVEEAEASMLELYYLSKEQMSISGLLNTEGLENLEFHRLDFSTRIRDAKDMEQLAGLLADMMRGLVLQFSILGNEVNYMQLSGLSVPFKDGGFAKPLLIHRHLSRLSRTLSALEKKNRELSELARSELTGEELRLLDDGARYLDQTGPVVGLMCNQMSKVNETDDFFKRVLSGQVEERDKGACRAFDKMFVYFGSLKKWDHVNASAAGKKQEWVRPSVVPAPLFMGDIDDKELLKRIKEM